MLGDTHNHMPRLHRCKYSTNMEHFAFLRSRGTRWAHEDFSMVLIESLLLQTHKAQLSETCEIRIQIFSVSSSTPNIPLPHHQHAFDLL